MTAFPCHAEEAYQRVFEGFVTPHLAGLGFERRARRYLFEKIDGGTLSELSASIKLDRRNDCGIVQVAAAVTFPAVLKYLKRYPRLREYAGSVAALGGMIDRLIPHRERRPRVGWQWVDAQSDPSALGPELVGDIVRYVEPFWQECGDIGRAMVVWESAGRHRMGRSDNVYAAAVAAWLMGDRARALANVEQARVDARRLIDEVDVDQGQEALTLADGFPAFLETLPFGRAKP